VGIFSTHKKDQKAEPTMDIRVLYDRYAPGFLGLCYRYCGNREDAEDILHDGFMAIIRNIDRFEPRGDGSLEAWMKKIIVNTALKFLRENTKYKKLLVFDTEIRDEKIPEPGFSESYPEISQERLLRMITELPLGYRTVFNFYVMEHYSHKEISEMLNISENTSKTQLAKARMWLKKRINDIVNEKEYEHGKASAG
jgi:RNA polymerase sigma-70 factor, ECF subfamily